MIELTSNAETKFLAHAEDLELEAALEAWREKKNQRLREAEEKLNAFQEENLNHDYYTER